MADVERSKAQADELALRAHAAAEAWADATQAEVDHVIEAMAQAGNEQAQRLADLAYEETGYGRPDHKAFKNLFNSQFLFEFIRHVPTVGVIAEHPGRRYVEIAEPVGVIAGLIPVTNPTSTVMFKGLIAVKARNAIVCAPHPRAVRCSAETARVMDEAAVRAGAPPNLVQCMTEVSLEGTDALMRHYRTDLILATGSRQMVLAAYSCGKPTYAVGPGNTTAYVHRSTRDLGETAAMLIVSSTFDNGTPCASEQAVVVDAEVAARFRAELEARGTYFCNAREQALIERMCFPQGPSGPAAVDIVGQYATRLAEMAGIGVPAGTRMLVVRPVGVGRDHPLSREILCPILKWYEARSEEEAFATAHALLKYGGDGHTAAVHAEDDGVVGRFASRMPAYRIVVNETAIFGASGYTTGVDPSYMLGTGTIGGTITSDNIGPRHLVNVKRVALPVRSWREAGLDEAGHPPHAFAPPVASPDVEAFVREVVERVMAHV
jgi:acetaldehyde dehydrogenase (acetylating)